ncbi:Gibberellin 20 oxidase 1-D [Platanthera zijinensis]|uniref:Gibberellin 20 oxidase 1-D n=1 Tax=Platanthera zijinensis TaxID=2320716 RepID=A0AAP0BKN2_9ASPA
MAGTLQLPLVDLYSGDRAAAVRSIRQACLDHGFFYLINHGIDGELFRQVFGESQKFFLLPLEEKLKLDDPVDHYAYIPPHAEIVDPSKPKGLTSSDLLPSNFLINPRRIKSFNSKSAKSFIKFLPPKLAAAPPIAPAEPSSSGWSQLMVTPLFLLNMPSL